MATDPIQIVPSRRVRGSTLTRLGAALAACAVRAEQRPCLAELNAHEVRDAAVLPEPSRPELDKPSTD